MVSDNPRFSAIPSRTLGKRPMPAMSGKWAEIEKFHDIVEPCSGNATSFREKKSFSREDPPTSKHHIQTKTKNPPRTGQGELGSCPPIARIDRFGRNRSLLRWRTYSAYPPSQPVPWLSPGNGAREGVDEIPSQNLKCNLHHALPATRSRYSSRIPDLVAARLNSFRLLQP